MNESDLVEKLRTCSNNETRDVAMELAHIGTDEAVEALIKIAEGGIKIEYPLLRSLVIVYRRPAWWKRKVPVDEERVYDVSIRYNLYEQITAIEALAETGSQIAIDYINRVLEFTTKISPTFHSTCTHQPYCGECSCRDGFYQGKIYFPNASGALKKHLDSHCYIESGHLNDEHKIGNLASYSSLHRELGALLEKLSEK